MRRGLSIGEFARLTRLSVRTLRRYHEAGLLAPASVDPASGYRYYAGDQIPVAHVIHRLRELDVPLADVRLRAVAPRTVAAITATVRLDDVLEWYADAMSELDAAVAGHEPLGPPGGRTEIGWPVFRLSGFAGEDGDGG